jgi:modulator of FtsH protease HflK
MDQFRPRNDQDPVREIQRGVEDLRAMMDRFFHGRGMWLLIVVPLLLYALSGFYIVGPGERGVVLLFGRVSSITDPGLRYRLPRPFMTHAIVDIAKVRQVEIGYRTDGSQPGAGYRPEGGRVRSIPAESLMLTGDENIVDVQMFVQYTVQDPVKFLFGAENPDVVLRTSAEVALRGAVGANTIDYTMTDGREEIQKRVEIYLQKLLDTYDTGLRVSQTQLLTVDPPSQVKEAFHDVVRALENREQLIQQAEGFKEDVIPRARGQAQQDIREAEQYKAQRVIRARGDAEMFTKVLSAYVKAPVVTRERLYLESIERFLPAAKKIMLEGGDSKVLPLLPLPIPGASPKIGSGTGVEPVGSEPLLLKKGN